MAHIDSCGHETLSHINVPPAQTWNYLKIDECSLVLPKPKTTGDVFARLPRLFDGLDCGIGAEAVSWIEDAAGDARYIEVPAHTHRDEPIAISVDADAGEAVDAGVMVRHGAHARIVLVSSGTEVSDRTSAALLRVICERDATAEIVEIVAVPEGHQHLEGVGIACDRGAVAEVRQYMVGGHAVASGLAADLAQEEARLDLSCRYIVRGDDLLDISHVARQRGERTRCDMAASGILSGAARKTLRETIDLVHGGKGSKGNELETVLMAGDEIVNKTLPVILCDEDDVQGNHGASIGSISPEQEAYLAARGLSEEAVHQLFARAIFDDALIHAPEEASREALGRRAAAVLGPDAFEDAVEGLEIGADA